jgi:archaellum component FlaC
MIMTWDLKMEAKITALDLKMESKITDLDLKVGGKINELDSKIGLLDSKIGRRMDMIDSRMERFETTIGSVEKRLDGKMEKVLADVHRGLVLAEEQRGENKIVLDAIKTMMDRQDKAETEMGEFKRTLSFLSKAKESPI